MEEKNTNKNSSTMNLTELLEALAKHKKRGKGYQIQLNSGNLDSTSNKHMGVELGDIYFTEWHTLNGARSLLCFGNMCRKPIGESEDGANLYPSEINTQMYIDLSKIEMIEEVTEFEDWFEFPSNMVINIYMLPENDNLSGNRNVITIGILS